MKNTSSKAALVTATITLALASFAAPAAKAGHENDLVRLSHDLEELVLDLRHEFKAHYLHTAAYRHLVSDASRIEDEAEHIHRLAHDPVASLRHINADLEDLDALAHHLHDLVDRTEEGRYGHVHGCTKHVHEMLTALNRVIHAMEAEVENLSHRSHDEHHPSGESFGYSGHCEGFTFQRGGFRLSFYR